MTINELMRLRKLKDCDLDQTIQEEDITELAAYFDNVDNYIGGLGLKPGQQTDVRNEADKRDTKTAVIKALKLWREPNPFKATYRALIEIVLEQKNGVLADNIACYLLKLKK